MKESVKVEPHHLERGAYLYVRQSSMRQVVENVESTKRQYALRGRATALGWPPIDKAVGRLVAEQMTPAAVELALEIRREIEARHEEADRLRCRAIERAQIEADLAQRRFMLVDPNNRLVADTLEGEWNEKLRVLAKAREDREHAPEQDQFILDEAPVHSPADASPTPLRTLAHGSGPMWIATPSP
jgi:hypothetical protein